MGCDIHIYTEANITVNGKEKWWNVDDWRLNPYFGEDYEPEYSHKSVYSGRNYELFAYIANVRNYGEVESAGFDRGLPENVSEAVKREFDWWEYDAHTPGWCTLAELKKLSRKTLTTKRQGYVAKEEAKNFKENGTLPTAWAQGVGNKENYEWLKWEDKCNCFDSLIENLDERKREVFWIFDKERDDNSMDDKIRIIFWFDN